jgi:glyoxylase-like metal-dependent hydrolase (beta-lactamase superfamily II)
MKKVDLHLSVSGFCLAKESHAIRSGKNNNIHFHALWGLIKHPSKGLILFDTGYTRRFYDLTAAYPSKVYAKLTKVNINEENEVSTQLNRNEVNPMEIEHVIISHFHADHVGGLKDFPNANFYCSKAAYEQFSSIPNIISFSKGILKKLIPDDFKDRLKFIEDISEQNRHEIFKKTFDLFGDGSLEIVQLPGHAAGQIGLILETNRTHYFLVADAVWLRETYEFGILPNQIVRLFFHSWRDYKASLNQIRTYSQTHPETKIIPSHCWASYKDLISTKINWDAL